MSRIVEIIVEMLSKDIVSHGLLVQCIEKENAQLAWELVLPALLSEDVEIGDARLARPDYVEFIAWTGRTSERVARALRRVENLVGPDREFAYWLALRQNVDRFEEIPT